MSSPLQNVSSSTFDASILTLQADFSSGLTLLTTAPTANEFFRTTISTPCPPEKILKEIVQKIWGHSSVQTVDVGEILENGYVTDDLSLEACITGYAKKRLKLHHKSSHNTCSLSRPTNLGAPPQSDVWPLPYQPCTASRPPPASGLLPASGPPPTSVPLPTSTPSGPLPLLVALYTLWSGQHSPLSGTARGRER
ncbi:uncharacterized protein EI90DRAFT_3126495 [Cantharellus anzutake]|uniref:uncharacterized protein n=1 Tax=Cantharellus anzutake TaxID=1750568 RepID=UPI001905B15B|nr:uncharacterized protein EI90DRAFT_3126495 [Cantharellus anzutake]KAF8327873.1 hypothetical protein EI90DRAFT_3126495 [Cantharellus anzutake]